MKKLLMFLVLLAMAGAAGYIYWQRQAKFLERDLASTITRFNEEVKANTGITPIEYQGITLNGFPFSISLTLHKPILRLPLHQWVRNPTPGVTWVEEHKFQGDLSLSADWKVTRYTLRLPAEIESVSIINGVRHFVRRSSAQEPLKCSLALNMVEAFDKLWQPLETLQLAFTNISLLRDASCTLSGYRLEAELSKKPAFITLDSGRFMLDLKSYDAATNQANLSLSATAEKFHASALNDQYYHSLFSAFPELDRRTKKGLVSLEAFSRYGEQNLSVQADYTGPLALPGWNSEFSLSLPNLDVSNALYSLKASVTANNKKQESDSFAQHYDLDLTGSITPAYEQLMRDALTFELQQRPQRIGMGNFYINTGQLHPVSLKDFTQELFPRLAEISPMTLKAKGESSFQPPEQPGNWPSPVEFTLESAKLHNAAWKVALKGKGSYAKERLLPSFDAQLDVENGDLFFSQAANKLILFEKWRQRQQQRPPILITNPYLTDLKRFVDAVARGNQEALSAEIQTLGNPSFHVKLENFLPQINGLSINEILMLFNELLMPHLSNLTPAPENAPSRYQSGG